VEEIYQCLIKKLPKENILKEEIMAKHTSFKIGGRAEIFVKVKTIEQLKETLKIANENKTPYFVMGNGSNLLVKDGGFRGLVLKIELKEIEVEENNEKVTLKLGAGIPLIQASHLALEKSAAGLEFACGIPGTVRWSCSNEFRSIWKRNEGHCLFNNLYGSYGKGNNNFK